MNRELCEWARFFFELSAVDRRMLRGLALVKLARLHAGGDGRSVTAATRHQRVFVFVLPEPLVLGR